MANDMDNDNFQNSDDEEQFFNDMQSAKSMLDELIAEIVERDSVRLIEEMRNENNEDSRNNMFSIYAAALSVGGWVPSLKCTSADELFLNSNIEIHRCITSAFVHLATDPKGTEFMEGLIESVGGLPSAPPFNINSPKSDTGNDTIEFTL